MPDRRKVKLVITAIADGGNFDTGEYDGDAATKVVDVVADDDVTLHEVLQRCHRILVQVVEE
jgi:hypothetical protein